MSTYFISPDGQNQEGPLTLEQLQSRAAAGQLAPGTLAWREGLANWSPITAIPELQSLAAPAPQPAAQPAPQAAPQAVTFAPTAEPVPEQQFRTFAPPQHPGLLSKPSQSGQTDGLSVASLVLGCISILISCMHVLSLPFSITGLILGCVSKTKTGVRTAGIVTSSIGLGLALIMFVLGILGMAFGGP